MKVIQALEGGVLARPVVGKMELGWRGQDAVNDKMTIPVGKLTEALDILKDVEGIGFVKLGQKDIVRHKLVTRIVNAYDAHDAHEKTQN